MPLPIDPSFAVAGPEWSVAGVEPLAPTAPESAGGFGDVLAQQIGQLSQTQAEASAAAQGLAAGTVSDPTEVVMAVERARLSMQLAAQIRTKAVEAAQDIFHTQV